MTNEEARALFQGVVDDVEVVGERLQRVIPAMMRVAAWGPEEGRPDLILRAAREVQQAAAALARSSAILAGEG